MTTTTTLATAQRGGRGAPAPSALRALTALLTLTVLTACQHAPAPTAPAPVQTLQRLGFVAVDAGWQLDLGVKLLFESDSAELSANGRDGLARLAGELRSVGIARMRIDGHTDNEGSTRHNAALSLRRADAVARLLVEMGWPERALQRKGFGPDRPVADNGTAEGRAQNRRVVITVTAPD